MRDNHSGMPEIIDVYERDGLYFGVVRVELSDESAAFEFSIDSLGYKAIKKVLQSKPFGEVPGVTHRYFYARSYSGELGIHGKLSMNLRIEAGCNAKTFDFEAPSSLLSNLVWFGELEYLGQAAALNRVQVSG